MRRSAEIADFPNSSRKTFRSDLGPRGAKDIQPAGREGNRAESRGVEGHQLGAQIDEVTEAFVGEPLALRTLRAALLTARGSCSKCWRKRSSNQIAQSIMVSIGSDEQILLFKQQST